MTPSTPATSTASTSAAASRSDDTTNLFAISEARDASERHDAREGVAVCTSCLLILTSLAAYCCTADPVDANRHAWWCAVLFCWMLTHNMFERLLYLCKAAQTDKIDRE